MKTPGIVIVTWNSASEIEACLASIPDCRAIVVDNGSTDDSVDRAEARRVRVLRLNENRGFAAACNAGWRVLAAEGAEAVLFLNPDARLVGGALSRLQEVLDSETTAAAVAPRLTGEGQERFQLRRLPTLGSLAREMLFVDRLWPLNAGLRAERYLDRDRSTPFEVEQPAAAALLVRTSDLERTGGFDEGFFPAWFEDVDLCRRLQSGGRRILFVPSATVRHEGGVTMRRLAYRDYLPLYWRHFLRYAGKHEGPLFREASRGLIALGMLLRLAALTVTKGDHPRGDAARAYARVLRGLGGLGWRSALWPAARGLSHGGRGSR